jgi:hypothetical protein
MERTPKQTVTLNYSTQELVIDGPCQLRVRHYRAGKAKVEIEGYYREPVVKVLTLGGKLNDNA